MSTQNFPLDSRRTSSVSSGPSTSSVSSASTANAPLPAPNQTALASAQSFPQRSVPPKTGGNPLFFLLKLILSIIIIFVIGVAILTVMRSVKGGGNSGNAAAEKVTLEYWGLWEDPTVMKNVISDFEKENPNITINYVRQDPKEYSDRLLTHIKNGNGPDIFRFHNTWIPMVMPVLLPIPQNVMTKEEFANSFYPVIQKDLVHNGAIYGIPLEIDTLALFTNNAIFQKESLHPPTTWTDFITIGKALTIKDVNGKIQQAGAAMGSYDNITHAPDLLSLLFVQNGVDMDNFDKTTSNASDALTFYTSFAKGDASIWDATLDPSMNMFARGSVAMYFGYSWDVLAIQAINPNLQFTINPVPHLPGRNMTIASYWVEGVSAKTAHQKEAFMFMKFLAQKETEQKLYSEQSKIRPFGEPYARTDLAETVKDNPYVYPFLQQAQNAASSLFAGETQDDMGINGHMNGYLANAVNGILKTNTSADSAITTLAQGVAQVLQQYAQQQ